MATARGRPHFTGVWHYNHTTRDAATCRRDQPHNRHIKEAAVICGRTWQGAAGPFLQLEQQPRMGNLCSGCLTRTSENVLLEHRHPTSGASLRENLADVPVRAWPASMAQKPLISGSGNQFKQVRADWAAVISEERVSVETSQQHTTCTQQTRSSAAASFLQPDQAHQSPRCQPRAHMYCSL